MDFFEKAFNWLANLSSKLPAIPFKTYFIVVIAVLIGVGVVVALTYLGSRAFKLASASKKIRKYLETVEEINDDNVSEFTARCFSAKAPQPLRDSWVQYLGVRYGYPSDVVSDKNVYDKVVKRNKDHRSGIYLAIALIVLGVFAFWGFGTLDSISMSVVHFIGLVAIGVTYLVLVVINRKQSKRCQELFESMQEDLDAKVNLQVESSYATDSSPLAELSRMVDEIIARNTSKAVDFEEEYAVEQTPIEALIEEKTEEELQQDVAKDDDAPQESEVEQTIDQLIQSENDEQEADEQEQTDETETAVEDEREVEEIAPQDDAQQNEDTQEEAQSVDGESDQQAQDGEDAEEQEAEEAESDDLVTSESEDVQPDEEVEETAEENIEEVAQTQESDESSDSVAESEEESQEQTDEQEQTEVEQDDSAEQSEETETAVEDEREVEEIAPQDDVQQSEDTQEETQSVDGESDGQAQDGEDAEESEDENADYEDAEETQEDVGDESVAEEIDEDEADAQEEIEDEEQEPESEDEEREDEEREEVVYVVEGDEDDEESVKPAKLVKLPNLVDYMLTQNMPKAMKIQIATMLIGTYKKFENSKEDRKIVVGCLTKLMRNLQESK